MYHPKTGELETFWTGHSCDDNDCPGKRKVRKRAAKGEVAHPWTREFTKTKEVQAWLDAQNRDSPTYTKHSPSYWHDEKPQGDALGWDDPTTGKPENLYGPR